LAAEIWVVEAAIGPDVVLAEGLAMFAGEIGAGAVGFRLAAHVEGEFGGELIVLGEDERGGADGIATVGDDSADLGPAFDALGGVEFDGGELE
jgi:hypothetical protein